jgi:putative transposase
MQSITLSYSRLYQKKYNFIGHLWQGRFKSMIIQTDEYLLECLRYVESNPVRAGIVKQPQDYHFSTFNFHAYGRDEIGILDKDPCYLSLADTDEGRQSAYRKFFAMPQDESLVQAIRKAIESGFVLARQGFSDELKQTVELKKPRSRGRPKEKNLSITR